MPTAMLVSDPCSIPTGGLYSKTESNRGFNSDPETVIGCSPSNSPPASPNSEGSITPRERELAQALRRRQVERSLSTSPTKTSLNTILKDPLNYVPEKFEKIVEEYLNVLKSSPKEHHLDILSFVRNLPKAELHSHTSGAVHPRHYLDLAYDRGFFWDDKASKFCSTAETGRIEFRELYKQDQNGEYQKYRDQINHEYPESKIAEAKETGRFFDPERRYPNNIVSHKNEGRHSVRHLMKDTVWQNRVINMMSMDVDNTKNSITNCESGHSKFFESFFTVGSLSDVIPKPWLLKNVLDRAVTHKVKYYEAMIELLEYDPLPEGYVDSFPENLETIADESLNYHLEKLNSWIAIYVERCKRVLDDCDVVKLNTRSKLNKKSNPRKVPGLLTDKYSRVVVRYIIEVMRTQPLPVFFAHVAAAMKLIQSDDRVVSVNSVGPEHDFEAMRSFENQLKLIKFLREKFEIRYLTQHGGELSRALADISVVDHVTRLIHDLGVERIGHAVSIWHEKDPSSLCETMVDNEICVETCFTSNENILGTTSKNHPIKKLAKAGVPIVLCTDDEGVNNTDASNEFQKAISEYGFGYLEIKGFIRNSIHYAFVEGESIYERGEDNQLHLKEPFFHTSILEWFEEEECKELLEKSTKAYLGYRIEKALAKNEITIASKLSGKQRSDSSSPSR